MEPNLSRTVVRIHAESDIRIIGGASGDMQASTKPDGAFEITRNDNEVRVRSWKPLDLHLPDSWSALVEYGKEDLLLSDFHGITTIERLEGDLKSNHCGMVNARHIGGDARFEDVQEILLGALGGDLSALSAGKLKASSMGGDVDLRKIEAVDFGAVGGDLRVDDCKTLGVEVVGGDATIRNVEGEARIRSVGGDLSGRDCQGALVVDACGGDASLRLIADQVYKLSAGGDLELRVLELSSDPARFDLEANCGGDLRLILPNGISVELEILSGSGDIDLRLDGEVLRRDSRRVAVRLGDGLGKVRLRAGGDVSVDDGSGGHMRSEDMGVEGPANSWLWHHRPSQEFIDQKVSEGLRMAQQQLKRMAERLDAKRERLEYDAGLHAEPSGFDSAGISAQASGGASAEERALIEKMLAEGRITREEADSLFDVL